MKVFVIPATYNEKDNIEEFIKILEEEVFPTIKGYDMYILVADDNSPDGTAEIVRRLMKKYKNLDVHVGERKGLGAAYSRVMTYAIEEKGADVVISIDADLQHDPRTIPEFLKKMEQGYDIVTSSRYSDGGSMPKNWPWYRKMFSIGANTVARIVTGRFYLHDWTGGFRAYKKEVFLKERGKLKSYSGYTFQVAALYKSLLDGYKIGEVPIHFYSRKKGDSKIAPAEYIYNYFKYVVVERFKELMHGRFSKFLIVGGTGFVVQMLMQEFSIFSGLAHLLAQGFDALASMQVSDLDALGQAIAAAIGAEAAILCNFFFNNYWTFQDTRKMKHRSSGAVRLVKFNATSLLSIALQAIAVWLGILFLGRTIQIASFSIPTRIAVLFPTIVFVVIPLNYVIYNKIIWKTHHLQHEKTA